MVAGVRNIDGETAEDRNSVVAGVRNTSNLPQEHDITAVIRNVLKMLFNQDGVSALGKAA